jgi:hypothetical protein
MKLSEWTGVTGDEKDFEGSGVLAGGRELRSPGRMHEGPENP